jgi:hypothetical protein
MEVSGQLHALAGSSAGKETRYPSDRKLNGHQIHRNIKIATFFFF